MMDWIEDNCDHFRHLEDCHSQYDFFFKFNFIMSSRENLLISNYPPQHTLPSHSLSRKKIFRMHFDFLADLLVIARSIVEAQEIRGAEL